MCLAIPAKVVEIINADLAEVEIYGNSRNVSITLVPEVKVNEYVLIHAGCAIAVIDEESAIESLKVWREWSELENNQ